MVINEVTSYLESIAPLSLQESYDNSGLLVGDKNAEINAILLTLDVTEEVLQEAITKKCNLIVAHHPLIFSGLKKLTGKNEIERCIILAIKSDIAIYACHTNLDNITNGVNKKFADKLGLINTKILAPKKNRLQKLTTYVPLVNTEDILEALSDAGAGNIGEYEQCSFIQKGIGSFKPTKKANPHIGNAGILEHIEENRIEVLVPDYKMDNVLTALFSVHPYEEVAYYITPLENINQEIGSGMIGYLPKELSSDDFLKHLKESLNLELIKYTPFKNKIKKIAICGGSGKFLLNNAINVDADAFVTSDFKYHEYFEAEKKIMIADIGHYESEVNTKELFYEVLTEKFTNIALVFSETYTNPIRYYK